MARRIVITSGKGGVGKTTVCALVGMKLAELGFRVALLDLDVGLNNLDVVLGMERNINYDILDVIAGNCRLKQALIQHEKLPNLYIMASTNVNEDMLVTKEQIKDIVDTLSQTFDYILLDCPAGVEEGFRRAVFSANEAIVVVTPHISSVRDADKVLSILAGYDLLSKGLIVNRVRGDLIANYETLDLDEIIRFLKTKLLGVIPDDDTITKGDTINYLHNQQLGRSISLLVENIHNGTRKIFDCGKKYRGFWGMIRRNIKKKV